MDAENKLGSSFESLAHRVLYSYIATYPIFVPIENSVSVESQEQMYTFMKNVLTYIYNNPEILGVADENDECYESWQLNNSKPQLIKVMEKIEGKFASFLEMLIKIGRVGEIIEGRLVIRKSDWAVSKTTREKLQLLGVDCEQTKENTKVWISKYPLIFEAWKMYSENDDGQTPKMTRVIAFIHGRYLGKRYKAVDFFSGLVEDKDVLADLEKYLEANSFAYVNAEPSTQTRYAQTKWIKEYPKNEIAYMRVYFDWRKKFQMVYEFRLPQFRILLNYYDDMEENLKEFVFHRLKVCDDCGYCTQTDKSGKRKRLSIDLTCKNEVSNKCPLYPNFTWNYMNKDELINIKKLFAFAEKQMHSDQIKQS